MNCVEKKTRLSGEVVSYQCELLSLERDHGVLRYVVPDTVTVGDLLIEKGSETYAVYWPGRNYNLYCWVVPGAQAAAELKPFAYYFNIVDSVSLTPAEFAYRDLAVDLLVFPDGEVRVLDEDELADGADQSVRDFVNAVKRQIQTAHGKIIAEATEILVALDRDR